jgi:hypothetical protein
MHDKHCNSTFKKIWKYLTFSLVLTRTFGTDGGEGSAAFTSPELQALFDQYGRRLTAKGNILLNIPSAGARIIIDADNVDTFARALASRYVLSTGYISVQNMSLSMTIRDMQAL